MGSAKEESIVRYSAHTTCPVLSPEPGSLVWYTNACMLSHFSCICFFATPWTVACQAPLSMGFSRQEYGSGLPFPTPGDLPNRGIKPVSLKSPALETLPLASPGKPHHSPLSSVTQSCLTLQPHGQQHPGFHVHHQLAEPAQTHVHQVGDAVTVKTINLLHEWISVMLKCLLKSPKLVSSPFTWSVLLGFFLLFLGVFIQE